MTRKRTLATSLAAAAVAALALSAGGADAPIPDREIGLSKASVFETPEPAPVVPDESEPGEGPSLAPAPEGFPPRIPHGVADFVPITATENACVDCHAVEVKEEGEPTPIPASHYEDLRNAPGKTGDVVAGARWACLGCHVGTTGGPAASR